MARDDMHILFQQMGEVLTGISALHETIDMRQVQVEQLYNLMRTDLVALRHDHRELEEKFDCMVSVVQHELESIGRSTTDNARSVDEIIAAFDALRRPVMEIVGLKSRVGGVLFGAGLIGSAALWLAEPVYGWLVNNNIFKR